MELVEKKQNEIVFTEDCIAIVLNGKVILREHQKNTLEHKIIASYIKGQIIGFKEGDYGLTKLCNVWAICESRVV